MNTITIMQGIPGSGKSTRAKEIAAENGAVIVSADEYFMDLEGNYVWNQQFLHAAHTFCQKMAATLMRQGKNVIIDNTNLKERDYRVYVDLASIYGYDVKMETIMIFDVDLCTARNTHKVPRATIQRMVDTLKQTLNIK